MKKYRLLGRGLIVSWVSLFCETGIGASVHTKALCPHEPKESCRWQVSVGSSRSQGQPVVEFHWSKLIESRHWRKPLADALRCNIDRSFNPTAGGYLRVWFTDQGEPCDAMAGDPANCGVKFLLDDPLQFHSARGLVVQAPKDKKLARVELYNTLDLQCGDFSRPDYLKKEWKTTLGWRRDLPGDGTYQDSP